MADRESYISNNLGSFLQLITLDKLVPELKDSLFGSSMKSFDLLTEPVKKKEFILQHMFNVNNGNDFDHFIQILLHTGHDALAFKLSPNCVDMIDYRRCDPRYGLSARYSFGSENSGDCLKREYRELSSSVSFYPMDKSPRGFCFLVNNYFTAGTYKEMQRFRNIFYQLHFDVIMEKNLDAKDIVKRLLILSKSDELKNHNAFVFMIITHGNENKEILGFDNERINIDLLTEMFDNQNCPQLQNKPRMFFFNCCRGIKFDYGVPLTHSLSRPSSSAMLRRTLPKTNDFLICYSTLDGYVAAVDWKRGTFFGKALADSLVEKAWYKDINSILINANNDLQKTAKECSIEQPFEWNQCLTKQIIFFPFKPSVIEIK